MENTSSPDRKSRQRHVRTMWKKLLTKASNTMGSSTSTGNKSSVDGTFQRCKSGTSRQSPNRRGNLRGDLGSLVRRAEGPYRERLQSLDAQNPDELVIALKELRQIVHDAWTQPSVGHELALTLLEIMGEEGFLHRILEFLDSDHEEIQTEAARLVELSLSYNNRTRVAKNGLDKLVRLADVRASETLGDCGLALLERMFKHSEATCSRIVQLGGLEVVLYACRSESEVIKKHCAKALANCAMYGGRKLQKQMVKLNSHQWLFTLAFSKDVTTCYYASLATAFLLANREVEDAILTSGANKLVEKFVISNDPDEFAMKERTLGRGREWIEKLVPLLLSQRREAQCMAAFQLAMEATLKLRQDRVHDFYEIGIINPLKRVASSIENEGAANLAIRALQTIGEDIPPKLRQDVYSWSTNDVQTWLHLIGFENFGCSFCKENRVDGELLLTLTERELERDLGMTNGVSRKRFMRELALLKEVADYSSCDPDNLADELRKVGPEYAQHTFNLVHAGISKPLIATLTPDQLNTILKEDCAIDNGVHRINIVEKFTAIGFASKPESERDGADIDSPTSEEPERKMLDVVISYRRSNGSQLASLLKVHLQLRGFKVYLDLDRQENGHLNDRLLGQIRAAKNAVLVLSEGALDGCIVDEDNTDWIHREIATALAASCNIVPVLFNFKWPPMEQLPEDIRKVCCYNGIKWIHDYQDACVDKLERFLRQPAKPKQLPTECSVSDAGSNGQPYASCSGAHAITPS